MTGSGASDNAIGIRLFDRAEAARPQLAAARADTGFRTKVVQHAAELGINVRVVARIADVNGFQGRINMKEAPSEIRSDTRSASSTLCSRRSSAVRAALRTFRAPAARGGTRVATARSHGTHQRLRRGRGYTKACVTCHRVGDHRVVPLPVTGGHRRVVRRRHRAPTPQQGRTRERSPTGFDAAGRRNTAAGGPGPGRRWEVLLVWPP